MELGEHPRRLRAVGRNAVSTVLLVVSMTACGLVRDDSASATWVLAPHQEVSADTSEFDVLVTRTGCNGGVTGDVLPPQIDRQDGEVVLTFTVQPDEPSSAPCPSNEAVPYRVRLTDPLGESRLIDGYCAGEHTGDDVACMPNGVRYDPT